MAKARCYTPQLKPDVVSRLYHQAKAEHVPMTVLANRIMEAALPNPETITTSAENQQRQPKWKHFRCRTQAQPSPAGLFSFQTTNKPKRKEPTNGH